MMAGSEMMGLRRLITGASGFVGRRLWQIGDRALVRCASSSPDQVVGDLLDQETLRSACEGIDCVFHCAGYAHAFAASNPDTHWRINFEGTRNLMTAASAAGVKRFIFLSSVKAMAEPGDGCVDENWLGEPVTHYGKAKRAAEDLVLETGLKSGMHVVVLRLAMAYGRGGRGNLERMARGIGAGWFPPLPETHNRRSLVHVADVVDAMRLVAESPIANGKTYIVADSRPYSGREIYDAVCEALGKTPPARRIPAAMLRAGGRLGDAVGPLLGRPSPLTSEAVSRLLDSACYSPVRIKADLGWRAKVSLAEGLREMLG